MVPNYAAVVHEVHPTKSKFLERPARSINFEAIIGAGLKAGMTMFEALKVAGLRLQRDSEKAAPVDTGNLRISAYTRRKPKPMTFPKRKKKI